MVPVGLAKCSTANFRDCPLTRPLLIQEGARYTGDQETLPLCVLWIARQLREAAAFCDGEEISAEEIQTMLGVVCGAGLSC